MLLDLIVGPIITSRINKNYSKQDISKKFDINFNKEKQKQKERERFFSSKAIKTNEKEVRKMSDLNINNNKIL